MSGVAVLSSLWPLDLLASCTITAGDDGCSCRATRRRSNSNDDKRCARWLSTAASETRRMTTAGDWELACSVLTSCAVCSKHAAAQSQHWHSDTTDLTQLCFHACDADSLTDRDAMRFLVCAVGLLSVCALLCCSLVSAAYCHSHPSPTAQPNLFPITQPSATFVRSVPNGALYELLVHDQQISVVHLWGTPYQKGFAHGQLMQDKMAGFLTDVYNYIINQGAQQLNSSGVPMPEADQIVAIALALGLDATEVLTAPFTGLWYAHELQGMSDATGIPYDTIARIQMLGELTKGSCSMFGMWDQAIEGEHGLLTMRALDWITDGPFQNFHQLTVYHADTNSTFGTENTFLTMGWTGWIGSITGVNDKQMSIHEIGVDFPDATYGNESRQGVPFTYILRDILQFDTTRMDGVSRLASAHRTCDLILGVGDGKDRRFNSIAYGADTCVIMDDTNMKPVASWHPTINGTVYHAMDWECPGFNQVMSQQIESMWGSVTPALAIRNIMPIVQTGSLHTCQRAHTQQVCASAALLVVPGSLTLLVLLVSLCWLSDVADLPNQQFYVSFSANDNSTAPQRNAFDRQFAQIDLAELFKVEQPEKF